MDVTFKPGSITRTELDALLRAEYDAGGQIWHDLQDSDYNGGQCFKGEFWVLHTAGRTVIEHQFWPSYAAAVARTSDLLFTLEQGETAFSAVSHCAGELMPIITIEWLRNEDYRHSITIYPRFEVEI